MAYKSKFEPDNPEKYIGNVNNIICRSSWERWFANYLDKNTMVEYWTSEEVVIQYRTILEPEITRNYFVDFGVQFNNGQQLLVEIKPFHETQPPDRPKRKTAKTLHRYNEALKLYVKNKSKWIAAERAAKNSNAKFVVFTQFDLRKLGAPF